MTASTRPEIRLLDGEWWAREPYAEMAWMREHEPVCRDDTDQVWGVSRYADVRQAGR